MLKREEEVTIQGEHYKFCFAYRPFYPYPKVTYDVFRCTHFAPTRWEGLPRNTEHRLPVHVAAYGDERAEALARFYGHAANRVDRDGWPR